MTTTKVKTRKIEVVTKTITIIFDDYAIFELRGNEHSCEIIPILTEGRTIGEMLINQAVKMIDFSLSNFHKVKKTKEGYLLRGRDIDTMANRLEKQFAIYWDELTK